MVNLSERRELPPLPPPENSPDEEVGIRTQSPSRVILPAVPPLLAEAFCLLNFFTPGLGTILTSVSCCCARTRGMSKLEVLASVFCGLFIALWQILLTPLLLIGWIWSCFWGILITAQSDAFYKPRTEPDMRSVPPGIRPGSAGTTHTHAEPPPPYTFYDDYFQRGQSPPPPYSPPGTVAEPITIQPRSRQPQQPESVQNSAPDPGAVQSAPGDGAPQFVRTGRRASSAPPARSEVVNELSDRPSVATVNDLPDIC